MTPNMKRLRRLLKDYIVIKLGFALLTSYLLYCELFSFLVEKPTYTSSSKGSISIKGSNQATILNNF